MYDVSFYNSTASSWTLATPRTTWESISNIYIVIHTDMNYLFVVRIFLLRQQMQRSHLDDHKICHVYHDANSSMCWAYSGFCSNHRLWIMAPFQHRSTKSAILSRTYIVHAPYVKVGRTISQHLLRTKLQIFILPSVYSAYLQA